ncbi:MAG: general secretion pathway protein GspK [Synergistaceae bacterium]|nr:general secretion pathway protein GspK [Synergistaceae bacterium]
MSYHVQSRFRKSGFVMISVLILCSILISCATAFTWFVRTQARSVGGGRRLIEIRSMAETLAQAVISVTSEMSSHTEADNPSQKWYQPIILPFGSEGGSLGLWAVQVTPLDDKIPIRTMFLPDGDTLRRELSDVWEKLWETLGHRELEQLLLDFMDKNDKPRVGSAERDWYINRPPYDMSELLILSADISPSLLNAIEEYCTIYGDSQINLNTAPVHVMELLPGLDTNGLAQRIAQIRQEEPLTSLNDVQRIPGAGPKTSTQLTNIAAFKSRYFLLKIDTLESLSGREDGGTSFRIIFDITTRSIVRWEES